MKSDTPPTSVRRTRALAVQVENLSPAYFGMATGIVSLAANQVGLGGVAWVLFAIACVAYLVLWCRVAVKSVLLRFRCKFSAVEGLSATRHFAG